MVSLSSKTSEQNLFSVERHFTTTFKNSLARELPFSEGRFSRSFETALYRPEDMWPVQIRRNKAAGIHNQHQPPRLGASFQATLLWIGRLNQ